VTDYIPNEMEKHLSRGILIFIIRLILSLWPTFKMDRKNCSKRGAERGLGRLPSLKNARHNWAIKYTSENRVLNVERQVEELLGQTAQNKTEISRIENMISETGMQITQIQKEFDQQVFEEIRDVDLQLNDLRQQLVATKGQLGRVEIIAPISGTIHELSIFTKGGVITPGQPILQIVPDNSDMEFEVLVEPQFIDEIRLGQEASLFFSAFNARTTPNIDGVVDFVSLQTQIQENLGIPFYPVKIAISQEQIDRLNGQELISGMPFEAFFTTESRSPLNYLIKPLTDNLKRAGREQ